MRPIFLLSGTLLVAGCSVSSERIDCPQQHASGAAGLARETPAQIAAAGALLVHGGENAVGEIATQLRAKHPSASRGEIVNFLVTAYCPEVNRRNALDAKAKRGVLDAFANRADAITAKLVASPGKVP